jgi:hypothetical protein
MLRYQWSKLTNQQVGAYAEYFVKMELTMYGFQVYETEVDDRGIDFIARFENGPFIEIQVKSTRSLNYIFAQKEKFILRENLYLVVVLFNEGNLPELFLIPSLAWRMPNQLIVSRDYEGKKSKPEWGLNLSQKNLQSLEKYRLDEAVTNLM